MMLSIFLFVIAIGVTLFYHSANGQQNKVPTIGVLVPGAPAYSEPYMDAFRTGLRELGYIEGENIVIEYRVAQGKPDQYSRLATELINLAVNVIVTASTPAIQAVKGASSTIPIVMAGVAEPVENGLVASFSRPGGNITGLSIRSEDLSGKRLELLKEVIPKVHRVAVLWNPINASHSVSLRKSQGVAQAMKLKLQSIEMPQPFDLDGAFKILKKERPDALTVLRDPFFIVQLKRIVQFAVTSRLPTLYEGNEFVVAGGLMSYIPSIQYLFRRAAIYVDKILKGVKPADIPVEQPMRAELVINLKAAKEIGLTIPAEVLQRADQVIK